MNHTLIKIENNNKPSEFEAASLDVKKAWITYNIQNLLKEYVKNDVEIVFNSRIRRFIMAVSFGRNRITGELCRLKFIVSTQHLQHRTEEELRKSVLHEIAHLIDIEDRGYSNHDSYWKRICLSIGGHASAKMKIK